jgi:monoamine oxidase
VSASVATATAVVVVAAVLFGAPWISSTNTDHCHSAFITAASAFTITNTPHLRSHRGQVKPCVHPLQMSLASNSDKNNNPNEDNETYNDYFSPDVTKISIPSTTSRSEFHQRHYKVVIVGAGASGLQCCNTLMNQYNISIKDILLLEARSRIGGRIHTTFETANIVDDQRQQKPSPPSKDVASTTTFALDHGAAWVHGTGFDARTVIPETINEELQLDDREDEGIHSINPMMFLLETFASTIRKGETSEREHYGDMGNTYERRFHIKPIVNGNPWMRPRSVLHDDGQLGLYVAGRYMFGNVSNGNDATDVGSDDVNGVFRQALQRHYNILRQVQTIGNDMYDKGRGLETTTTSLADAIQMALTQLQEALPNDDAVAPVLGSDQQPLIAAIAPFYMLLLECWYGCEVSGMQLCEFIEDEDRILNYEDHTYHKAGDFIGPHCTLQNGMISVLQPLLQKGVKEQILCNEEVTTIRYEQAHVASNTNGSSDATATTRTKHKNCIYIETASGLHVTSETCVVTMPAGCLKEAAFTNNVFVGVPLSSEKIESISMLQMGSYKKIFLTFDRIFWPKEPAFLGLVRQTGHNESDSNEMYYKTKSTHPLGNCILVDNLWARRNIASMEIVLFGLAGKWSIGKSDDVIRDAVLDFISDAVNVPIEQLQEYYRSCHVTRWEEDRYSRGAYSSTALGTLPRHLQELRRPEWDDRLIFSGEATISEYDGSVFAALYSGMNAAKSVQEYFSSVNVNE